MRVLGFPNATSKSIVDFAQNNKLSLFGITDENIDKLPKVADGAIHYDIVYFPTTKTWNDNQFKVYNSAICARAVIINDYKNQMALIPGIQMFEDFQPIEKQLAYYIRHKLVCSSLRLKIEKDRYLYDILENYQESIFQSKIQPILYKGITNKSLRDEIRKAIVFDIFSVIKRDFVPSIEKYKKHIRESYYTLFTEWLNSAEAKSFCNELLVKKKDGLLDGFEVSYLYSVLAKKG